MRINISHDSASFVALGADFVTPNAPDIGRTSQPRETASCAPDRLVDLFPAKMLYRSLRRMEDTNEQLVALMREIEVSEPNAWPVKPSHGGYYTRGDLFNRNHPALALLKSRIAEAVQDYASALLLEELQAPAARVEFALKAWGVCLRSGHWLGRHADRDAHVSGLYYASVPPAVIEPRKYDGALSLYDPRPMLEMTPFMLRSRHSKTPAAGDLFLFPSWLESSISPFQGPGTKVCIAFNTRLAIVNN